MNTNTNVMEKLVQDLEYVYILSWITTRRIIKYVDKITSLYSISFMRNAYLHKILAGLKDR